MPMSSETCSKSACRRIPARRSFSTSSHATRRRRGSANTFGLPRLARKRCRFEDALNRVLAEDVLADVDVPGFDRSNVDGFAMQASDTFGAMEEKPRTVMLNGEVLAPGVVSGTTVTAGNATPIATGGMLPRGADAVLMVEHSEIVASETGPVMKISRALTAGENVSYAGTDIARGETVLRAGQHLTSREIGVLAALGTCEHPRLSSTAGCDLLDRQRDRRARIAFAPRRRLRLECRDHRRRRGRAWRHTRPPGRHSRRRGRADERAGPGTAIRSRRSSRGARPRARVISRTAS